MIELVKRKKIVLLLLAVLALPGLFACGKEDADLTPPALGVDPPGFSLTIPLAADKFPLTFSGTMEAGATVSVSVNNGTSVVSSELDSTHWQAIFSAPVEGVTVVTVTASDQRGNLNNISFSFNYDNTPPAVTLDQVLSPTALSGQAIGGTVETGATVTVNGATATVNGGYWGFSLASLPPGETPLSVQATDPAGNIGAVTGAVTVDPGAALLTIDGIAAEAASPLVWVEGVAVTTAGTVTLSGHYAPSHAVQVTFPAGTTTVATLDAVAGTWECAVAGLAAGTNQLSIALVDESGVSPVTVVAAGVLVVRDLFSPTISAVSPMAGKTVSGAALTQISATFAEMIDPASLNGTSFLLQDASDATNYQAIAGTVTYDVATRQAVFVPASLPLADGTYRASLTVAVQDLVGNPLGVEYAWSFTVAP